MNQEPKWVGDFKEHFVREDGLLDIGKYDLEMLLSYINAHFIPKEEVEKTEFKCECGGIFSVYNNKMWGNKNFNLNKE